MNTNNEKQDTSLQLSKGSTSEELKTYFTKVFELKQSGKEFPVDLEMVWPLVYERKDAAIDALKGDFGFMEGLDYNLLQKGKVVKSNELKNGIKIDVELSVPCLEFFIARKIRPVFEVYRQVLHQRVEEKAKLKVTYPEQTVVRVKMGEMINHVYAECGVIYAKISPIMKYLGYMDGVSTQYIALIGKQYFKKMKVGSQECWFISVDGFYRLLQVTTRSIKSSAVSDILQIYGVEKQSVGNKAIYGFSDGGMLMILKELSKKPMNKLNVQRLLLDGKK
jgi:hypothetical protein